MVPFHRAVGIRRRQTQLREQTWQRRAISAGEVLYPWQGPTLRQLQPGQIVTLSLDNPPATRPEKENQGSCAAPLC